MCFRKHSSKSVFLFCFVYLFILLSLLLSHLVLLKGANLRKADRAVGCSSPLTSSYCEGRLRDLAYACRNEGNLPARPSLLAFVRWLLLEVIMFLQNIGVFEGGALYSYAVLHGTRILTEVEVFR